MSAPKHSALNLEAILSAAGSIQRWRILVELAKGDPLPVHEVARRVRMTPNAASKQLLLLRKAGMLYRGYGDLYQIPKQFIVETGRALDFGAFVLRLDFPDEEAPRSKARSA